MSQTKEIKRQRRLAKNSRMLACIHYRNEVQVLRIRRKGARA